WTEHTPEGPKILSWRPVTAEQCAEAQRFYDDCRRLVPRKGNKKSERPEQRRSVEKQLVQAVLDYLESDEPKLAYADWLAAQGNSHGEFIRLSIALDYLSPDDPGYAPMD